MDVRWSLLVGAMVAGLALNSGCAGEQGAKSDPARPALARKTSSHINEAPPPSPVEIVGKPPAPDLVWCPGVWEWHGQWVWVRGEWAKRPQPDAEWVRGHWVQGGEEWTFLPGYWKSVTGKLN